MNCNHKPKEIKQEPDPTNVFPLPPSYKCSICNKPLTILSTDKYQTIRDEAYNDAIYDIADILDDKGLNKYIPIVISRYI